ncbi:MAG: hypothetical protein SO098_00600 [Prevotella sp.]|nr:hypothetical protein [Prevotella sp.]
MNFNIIFKIERSTLQKLMESRIEAAITPIVEDALDGTSIIAKLFRGVEPMSSLESLVCLLEQVMEQDNREQEWNGADDSRGIHAHSVHYNITGKERYRIPNINPTDREVNRRRKKAMWLSMSFIFPTLRPAEPLTPPPHHATPQAPHTDRHTPPSSPHNAPTQRHRPHSEADHRCRKPDGSAMTLAQTTNLTTRLLDDGPFGKLLTHPTHRHINLRTKPNGRRRNG